MVEQMKDVTAIARKLVASCKLLNLNITGDIVCNSCTIDVNKLFFCNCAENG